jgi:DNA-binding response OmpR family regulator
VDKEKVLSYSRDRNTLIQRELALRRNGFEVVSVESESQARFEIEMGRCGILLICFRTHPEKTREMTEQFRKNCHEGTIVFLMNRSPERAPHGIDYIVPESAGPEAIIDALRLGREFLPEAS